MNHIVIKDTIVVLPPSPVDRVVDYIFEKYGRIESAIRAAQWLQLFYPNSLLTCREYPKSEDKYMLFVFNGTKIVATIDQLGTHNSLWHPEGKRVTLSELHALTQELHKTGQHTIVDL